MGRKLKDIDQKQFEQLCGIQCTKDEICAVFNCDEKTLTAWCKRTYKAAFKDVFKAKSKIGHISLRRTQWKWAEKSSAMAIFLGKQYLGQSDNAGSEAPVDTTEVQALSPMEQLIASLKNAREDGD